MSNKQVAVKFYVEAPAKQKFLKSELMNLLSLHAGLVENADNYIWKIQARDEAGSVVTVTLYTSGNLVCMGHGKIFNLTLNLISLYHKSITK